jgi:ABC-2 type transport system permease protein
MQSRFDSSQSIINQRNNKSNKILTIIQHEYTSKVKTKGFIISTILGPLFLLLLIAVPALVAALSSDSTERKIAIVDKFSATDSLNRKIGEKIVAKEPKRFYLSTENVDSLSRLVKNKEIDGYLIIDEKSLTTGDVTVFTKGGGGIGLMTVLEKNIGDVLLSEKLKEVNADTLLIKLVTKGANIKTQVVTDEGIEQDYSASFAVIGYILGFFIYMMMLMYGSLVMRGVIEEKANRIIEVIVSSAKPFEIMMGKVVGIGLVGLTQVIFWVIIASVLFMLGVPLLETHISAQDMMAQTGGMAAQSNILKDIIPTNISPFLIIGFIVYFLFGYFIYATLFAAVGSAVDQESDAQQLSMVITIPIIIPLLLLTNIMSNPDGAIAVALSLIPFFTPILMTVRIAATSVPVWEVALSFILLALTFWGAVWAASRIYRIGILMYGKKPKLGDLIKWIRVK